MMAGLPAIAIPDSVYRAEGVVLARLHSQAEDLVLEADIPLEVRQFALFAAEYAAAARYALDGRFAYLVGSAAGYLFRAREVALDAGRLP